MLEYILLTITFSILFTLAYIKLKYPFWNIQPVYHTYNWWRCIYKHHSIVYKYRPVKTKFVDLLNVKTKHYLDTTDEIRESLLNLIQSNHKSTENIVFYINNADLYAYLTGQSEPSIISIYNETMPLLPLNKTKQVIQIGAITSRHLQFHVNETDNTYVKHPIYFIDFMGIDRNKDQIKYSRTLLQTHEYNQRIQNTNVVISLIKRNKDLFTGIVPLVEYDTHVYNLTMFKLPKMYQHYSIMQITHSNMSDYTHFFYNETIMSLHSTLFDIMIFPDIGNIISLLKKQILYIYCLKHADNVLGFYFFKNDKTHFEDFDCKSLRCLNSILNCNNEELFFLGYLHALHQIVNLDKDYKLLIMENIGHNHIIHKYWELRYKSFYSYKSAYYLFNYIYPNTPLLGLRCCIIA